MRSRILLAAALVAATTLLGMPGATGAPTYTCFGQVATIVGTPGDDVLIGREDTADVIVGLGGNDTVRGAEDVNAATAPGDRLCGGPGADFVRGGVGEDRIRGGSGHDDVDGSFNLDVVTRGGPGNDQVEDCDSEFSGGVRRIAGGAGDDHVCIDTDSARMYGNGGNDVLEDFKCGSDSLLSGGPGDDDLMSSFDSFEGSPCSGMGPDFMDADRVQGGDGNDEARVNDGDVVTEVESTVQE